MPSSNIPISTHDAPKAIGPYSQAIISGAFVFVSGQIAIDPNTSQFMNDSITQQTHQVIKNIQSILIEAGTTLSHVVKTTVYLKDLNDFNEMNEVYALYFNDIFPARSTIQAAALPKDAAIEMDVIASLK